MEPQRSQPDEGPFDLRALSDAVDEARTGQSLTWAALCRDVGVATSTIRRFATASDAEADGVLALVGWLGVPPEDFVINSRVIGALLPAAGDGVIRVDMALVVALPSFPPRARVGTRTTIQQLVAAAQESRTAVASLIRWSPT